MRLLTTAAVKVIPATSVRSGALPCLVWRSKAFRSVVQRANHSLGSLPQQILIEIVDAGNDALRDNLADKKDITGGLKTIERALHVLETVARSRDPLSIRSVSQMLDHNLSSTYNIVNTLIAASYLVKDEQGRLSIGSRVALLNAAFRRGDDHLRLLGPLMDKVASASEETVYLTRLVDQRVTIQAVVEGRQSLRVTGLAVGYHGAEDRRASGKAVMAFLDDEAVNSILQVSYSDESKEEIALRFERIKAPLEKVRSLGYAIDDEEFEHGICCVAAPYFGADGKVAGSLTVSAPAARSRSLFGPTRIKIVDTAAAMSAELSKAGKPPF